MNPIPKSALYLYGGLAVGALVVLYLAKKTVTGIITGDNALTRNATNAAGEPVTAYQNVPVLGTLGAATNYVLGGYPATVGQSIGGWAFDLFGPQYHVNPPVADDAADRFTIVDFGDNPNGVDLTPEEISRLRPRGGT